MSASNYWLDRDEAEQFAARLERHLNLHFAPPFDTDSVQVEARRFYHKDPIKTWNGKILIDHRGGRITVTVDQ